MTVTEEPIEIETRDGISDGFFYRPNGGVRYPGILYYTDIGGIRPASQDMARRLAAEGYAVLQPNVFYRTSKPPVFGASATRGEDRMKRFAELSAPLTEEAMSSDASAYVAFLEGEKSVKPGRYGRRRILLYGKDGALHGKNATRQNRRGGILSRRRAGNRGSGKPAACAPGHQSAAVFRTCDQRSEHACRSNRETRPGTRSLGRKVRERSLRRRCSRLDDARQSGLQPATSGTSL